MRNWDLFDWGMFVAAIAGCICAIVLVHGAIGIRSRDDDRQQNCRQQGGRIEHLPFPHSQDWNCLTPEKP